MYEILHKTNGQRYALKEMEIKNKAQMQMALSEAEMLKDIMENISHPNILHIEKVFQVGSKFYLVFPLCTGGELYDHVIRRGHFSEHDAAVLIKDLVSGLHQLHERDILHLDIKPENLLFESDRDDAMIKITDFGLSKIYKINNHLGGDDRNREPSRDELAAKLKAFSESGVLQRDKLRGTVGYMSPELILAGSCSKATDVWAAGVVLYILLCGRPPFQSKSNREILEKSARGLYTMEGEEWEGVSEEAKDLVKKMLIVDPKDRITTSSILEHPWIQMLDNSDGTGLPTDGSHINEMILQSVVDGSPLSLSTTSSGGGTVSPRPPVTQPGNTRKMSAQNLQGALKRLSGFVADRKTEKLATSFTRLVSSLNSEDQSNRTDLLTQFLHPGKVMKSKKAVPATAGTEEGGGLLGALSRLTSSRAAAKDPASASADEDDDDDEVAELALQALLNPDTRNSLAEAFTDVGANGGKLSIEQFIAVLKYFSFAGAEGNSNGSGNSSMMDSSSNSGMNPQQQLGVPALLFVRFVDRDGDGMISADDIFTTHALIMQMSAVFVKVIFRLYVEAIWYPGRQLNFLNLQRGGTTNGAAKKPGGYRVMEEQVNLDVVEPPRYITARHVSAVFEKLGYDASGGAKLFTVLCEALAKRGQLGIGAGMGSGDRASYAPEGERESTNSGLLGDDAPISKTTAVSASGGPERSVANTALVAAFTNEEDEIKKLSGVTENMSLNAIASKFYVWYRIFMCVCSS